MQLAEEAFFKQRRNLIASSLLVMFLNIAGGELKTLNLLGNKIEFTNSRVIPIALGVMLTYFVVRYLQYAHDVEDKGFKKRFYSRVEGYLATLGVTCGGSGAAGRGQCCRLFRLGALRFPLDHAVS